VGSVSGSDTVYTFRTELPSSPSFDLTLGLYTGSYPSPLGGIANADFSDTVRLSSIETFDASGNVFNFGSITGASRRIYDATGVHTAVVGVPEPTTWAMMLIGFAGLGVCRLSWSERAARRITSPKKRHSTQTA
jgi:PEP-CTERM motif